MTVTAPPRPPGANPPGELAEIEALREQLLIEEARQRARRRRRRYAAVVLLAAAVGAVVGFGRAGGELGGSGGNGPAGLASPTAGAGSNARNGLIAVADGERTLELVNPDGSASHAIHCPAAEVICVIVEPAWSPDGARFAFVRGRPYPNPAMSVYVTSGARPARMLAPCGDCGKSWGNRLEWSPDGAEIVFSRTASGGGSSQSLWVVHTRSGQLRQLTDCGSDCVDVNPDWSPNGEQIMFSRYSRSGASLYTVQRDGSSLTKLETPTPWASRPAWSPDGRKIAFDGGDKIFVAAADGSHSKLIVDGARGSGPGSPAWSPDGTKLAYFYTPGKAPTRDTPGRFTAEVWTINADGTHKRRLAASACCVSWYAPPVWSPDGKKLVFAANTAGGTYVVNANGSGLHGVSMLSADDLSWQPR